MISVKTLLFLLFLALGVCLAQDLESDLLSDLAAESGISSLAGFRVGRGRRESDAPFRMCGIELLQHVMDRNYCDLSKCDRRKRSVEDPEMSVFSRPRRASSTLLTTMCCHNTCRPSQILKVCCDGARG